MVRANHDWYKHVAHKEAVSKPNAEKTMEGVSGDFTCVSSDEYLILRFAFLLLNMQQMNYRRLIEPLLI